KPNELACTPFRQNNLSNTVPTLANNRACSIQTIFNTFSSCKNANRLPILFNSTNNSEDKSMISGNSILPEQRQHKSLS
ncbi:6784_t:CDS:2, partial [Dentiscutata heterogama]